MIRWLQFFVLGIAVIAGVSAVLAHRREARARGRWSTRGSLLLSLAMIVGTAPAIFVPTIAWLNWTGMLLSITLSAASLNLLRRQLRASSSHG